MGVNFHDLGFSNGLLGITPKSRATKEKNKLDFIKMSNFMCMERILSGKQKHKLQNERKYLYVISLIRDLDHIKNSYKTMIKDNPIKKWANDLNRHVSKEEIQVANKNMTRCSTSLAIQFSSVQSLSRVRLFATP